MYTMTENSETLKGVVNNITFRNEENCYTVARIITGRSGNISTVVGYIQHIVEGETMSFTGEWVTDPKHGRQFKIESYETVLPSTLEGIKRFLSSKYIEGVGEVTAERIVETFGEDIITVLDEHPKSLSKVPRISEKLAIRIGEAWKSHRRIRDIMIFLQSHDISAAYATRIYEKYKTDTVDKIRRNPYQLISDIRGIGFIKADDIARKLGLEQEAPERLRAGIMYSLGEFTDAGNTFVPRDRLLEKAAAVLDIDIYLVSNELTYLAETRKIVIEDDEVYHADLHDTEKSLAARLCTIARTQRRGTLPKQGDVDNALSEIEQSYGYSFAPRQREAILTAVLANAMVLTGGPGTGKTTTVQGMIALFERLGYSVLLCAPTGRAAKRMSEATGKEAKTIHRLLEYDPYRGRFSRDEAEPLLAHAVIMDEASMVDTELMAGFLRAVSPETTLVIVGDVDQLPSIGPGAVLRDIIRSEVLPVVTLTDIFRQAAQSRIVQSAHRINHGESPLLDNDHGGNFFFRRSDSPTEAARAIVDMVSRRLPKTYGFDPIGDIQVLTPMHKSETGVSNLNELLQERLNPPVSESRELKTGRWVFRCGDKVMQVRNNYDKLVFNGDIGRVADVDRKVGSLRVRFDDLVSYQGSELDDLVPAYAISVHKSQGSEFRCVVMPVTTQHFIMLRRNLLYTAVTRARDLVVLVGDFKALAIAVKNSSEHERFTALEKRLVAESAKTSINDLFDSDGK